MSLKDFALSVARDHGKAAASLSGEMARLAVPELGADVVVIVRRLEPAEREYVRGLIQAVGELDAAVAVAVGCTFAPSGKPMFKPTDMPTLKDRLGPSLYRIVTRATRLNPDLLTDNGKQQP